MENAPVNPPLPPRSGEQLTVDQSRRYKDRLRLYREWRRLRAERAAAGDRRDGRLAVGGFTRLLLLLNLNRRTQTSREANQVVRTKATMQRLRMGRLGRLGRIIGR